MSGKRQLCWPNKSRAKTYGRPNILLDTCLVKTTTQVSSNTYVHIHADHLFLIHTPEQTST